MINIEKYKPNGHHTNTRKKYFFSIKNKCEFAYELEDLLIIMELTEFNSPVDKYRQFEFVIVNNNRHSIVETSPGLILESDAEKNFIIFNQILSENPQKAGDLKKELEKRESISIELSVIAPGSLERDALVKNVEFLYKFALLPRNRGDFQKIFDLLDLYSEITIKQLKRHIAVTSIYQLLFFHALRADLESALISDETMVNASPLIKSVIKSLE